LVAGQLAAKGVAAVVGPIITNRAKVEMQGVSLKTAAELAEAGVTFAIMTDHPEVPIQHLATSAALAQKGGLSQEQALQAVTINAATILGLENRLGSIETGKDADIVIWDGDPLAISSKVEQVFINGQKIYSIK
jgi:imidazolonepropionase-like amidohydrolase